MADFVFGDSFSDVSRQETQRRALNTQRFFQNLAANRATVAQANQNQQQNFANAATVAQLQNRNRLAAEQQRANQERQKQGLALALFREQGLDRRSDQALKAGLASDSLRFAGTDEDRQARVLNKSRDNFIDLFKSGLPVDQALNQTGFDAEAGKQIAAALIGQEDTFNTQTKDIVDAANRIVTGTREFAAEAFRAIGDKELTDDQRFVRIQQAAKRQGKAGVPIDMTGFTPGAGKEVMSRAVTAIDSAVLANVGKMIGNRANVVPRKDDTGYDFFKSSKFHRAGAAPVTPTPSTRSTTPSAPAAQPKKTAPADDISLEKDRFLKEFRKIQSNNPDIPREQAAGMANQLFEVARQLRLQSPELTLEESIQRAREQGQRDSSGFRPPSQGSNNVSVRLPGNPFRNSGTNAP